MRTAFKKARAGDITRHEYISRHLGEMKDTLCHFSSRMLGFQRRWRYQGYTDSLLVEVTHAAEGSHPDSGFVQSTTKFQMDVVTYTQSPEDSPEEFPN